MINLRNIILEAYRNGQINAEMMEAGLERDEKEDYANWVLISIRKEVGKEFFEQYLDKEEDPPFWKS
jgi:hypothetical protein